MGYGQLKKRVDQESPRKDALQREDDTVTWILGVNPNITLWQGQKCS